MEEIENAVNQEKRKILDLDLIEEKEGIQLILFKIIFKSMINYEFILIINIFEFILKNIVDHKIKTEKIKRDNLTNVKVNMIDEIKFILRLRIHKINSLVFLRKQKILSKIKTLYRR